MPVSPSSILCELWRRDFKNQAVNNDTDAQLAIMTHIRVEAPFPENTSGSPLRLPGSYKLLTHLSRKHNATLV